MVDRDLILRRLALLDTYLIQLAPYRDLDAAAYQQDWKTQRVIERTLHLAIEVCMDVADHMVADRRLRIPETGAESFEILAERDVALKILPESFVTDLNALHDSSAKRDPQGARDFGQLIAVDSARRRYWRDMALD